MPAGREVLPMQIDRSPRSRLPLSLSPRPGQTVGKRPGPVGRVLASTPTGPFHSRPPNTAPDPIPDPAPPDPVRRAEHHQLAASPSPAQPVNAPLLKLTGTLDSHPATVLIDSGATTNFIDAGYVQRHHLPTEPMAQVRITLGDSSQRQTDSIT